MSMNVKQNPELSLCYKDLCERSYILEIGFSEKIVNHRIEMFSTSVVQYETSAQCAFDSV